MKIKFLLSFVANVSAQDNTWKGLKIEKENRCSPYNRSKDYVYSQTIENKIVESLENKIYSPYSGEYFKSIKETDIEHIVSLSEAHDSGLCAADENTKNRFRIFIISPWHLQLSIGMRNQDLMLLVGFQKKTSVGLPIKLLQLKKPII